MRIKRYEFALKPRQSGNYYDTKFKRFRDAKY